MEPKNKSPNWKGTSSSQPPKCGVPALHFPECIDVDPQNQSSWKMEWRWPAWRFKHWTKMCLIFLRSRWDPPKKEGFDSWNSRVWGSPKYQFRDCMILRVAKYQRQCKFYDRFMFVQGLVFGENTTTCRAILILGWGYVFSNLKKNMHCMHH